MTEQKIKEILSDYSDALKRLEQGLSEPSNMEIVMDGVIQRFEFTFELAWKLMKATLGYQGINTGSPRQTIKESFKLGLISDGDGWIDMLEDRNLMSHVYDARQAEAIYGKIKKKYFGNLKELETKVQNHKA